MRIPFHPRSYQSRCWKMCEQKHADNKNTTEAAPKAQAPPPPPSSASCPSTTAPATAPQTNNGEKPADPIADDLRERIAAAKKHGEEGAPTLATLQQKLADHEAKQAEQKKADRSPEDPLRYAAFRLELFRQQVVASEAKIASLDEQLEKLQAEKAEQQQILNENVRKPTSELRSTTTLCAHPSPSLLPPRRVRTRYGC